jgi:phosphoglycolate phosphatase
MLKLFIFDLDGTILDTIEDIHNSLMQTLKIYNFKEFDIETTKSYVGDGFSMLIKRAIGENPYKEEYEKTFREIYSQNQTINTKIFKNLTETLSHLKNLNKILIVLSNKAFFNTDYLIKHYKLDKYFDKWYGGDSFSEKKPSAVPIKSILNDYGIKCSDAIIIGDNYTDIEAGKNANIKTCFCKYGYGKLSDVRADFEIGDPLELKLLDGSR